MFENILLQEKKRSKMDFIFHMYSLYLLRNGAVIATIMEGIFYTKFVHKRFA